ncbi:MAG: VanZ family protein [Eudoraea sp.]|uniref:VanZ family protein n=1 Tax=Eudoraea sp. TaxID=1979955 RepID=UPI0035FB98C8
MKQENKIFGIIGFLAVLMGFLSKVIYRDFINLNEINDYGIAGFLPSYFYVLGFSLLLLIRPTKHSKKIVLIVTIASILFELEQWSASGKLDLKDIIASIFGCITAILIVKIIEKYIKKEKQST